VQGRPVRVVEPVAGVKWQQLDLCPLGQIRGLIDNEPAGGEREETTQWMEVDEAKELVARSPTPSPSTERGAERRVQ
jgi:hypothetical protein